jgi:Flp pilus assembly protein TadD
MDCCAEWGALLPETLTPAPLKAEEAGLAGAEPSAALRCGDRLSFPSHEGVFGLRMIRSLVEFLRRLVPRALKGWRSLPEPAAEQLARLNQEIVRLHGQGRYAEALALAQRSLDLSRRLLGDAHPAVAKGLNNLAALYQAMGRYAEGEPLYRQALALRRRLLGDEHPAVALSLNNLAALYQAMGRYAEAEPLYQEALALSRRLLGDEHPAVALSLNNLALLYQAMGRYADAEPLYQEALALSRRLLGDDYPQVATGLNNLAGLCAATGRRDEAVALMEQAAAIMDGLLGQVFTVRRHQRITQRIGRAPPSRRSPGFSYQTPSLLSSTFRGPSAHSRPAPPALATPKVSHALLPDALPFVQHLCLCFSLFAGGS